MIACSQFLFRGGKEGGGRERGHKANMFQLGRGTKQIYENEQNEIRLLRVGTKTENLKSTTCSHLNDFWAHRTSQVRTALYWILLLKFRSIRIAEGDPIHYEFCPWFACSVRHEFSWTPDQFVALLCQGPLYRNLFGRWYMSWQHYINQIIYMGNLLSITKVLIKLPLHMFVLVSATILDRDGSNWVRVPCRKKKFLWTNVIW